MPASSLSKTPVFPLSRARLTLVTSFDFECPCLAPRSQPPATATVTDALVQVPQPAPLGSSVLAFGATVSLITALPSSRGSDRPRSAGPGSRPSSESNRESA
jgi:hypothetical protein